MAAPTINDLDGLLSSLNQLKPPGASKNKIATITALCVSNVKAEINIVQSFYRALKKAPATHKLGALYVIDSVVRQCIEKAKSAGQDLNIEGRGEPGTYPAAVKRVTELMPALFDDIMKGIPADQKPKLENMITIWERGHTFPIKMLADFKNKLHGTAVVTNGAPPASAKQHNGSQQSGGNFIAPAQSRPLGTPLGFPPRHLFDQVFIPNRMPPPQSHGSYAPPVQQQAPIQLNRSPAQGPLPAAPTAPTAAADVNSILAALSKAAAAPAALTPAIQQPVQPTVLPPNLPAGLPPQLAALFGQQVAAPTSATQLPPQPLPYAFSNPSTAPAPSPGYQPSPQPFPGYLPPPPASIPQGYPIAVPPPASADPLAQLRGFLPENILNDRQKLIPALQLLQDLQKDGIPPERWGPVLKAFEEQFVPLTPAPPNGQTDHDRNRGRSRSPERGHRGGRGSPIYGSYDANARRHAEDGHESRSGHQRRQYRQRSPVRNSPAASSMNGRPMQPKFIAFDSSLPSENIKVLSRTLFVGGANGTQQDIQEIFERFGRVQTCIANRDKRHAFVKMTTRAHALAAKAGMEDLQNRNDREVMNVARQTKWGVGFGPRECCDYQRGESIIPIHKLTDADMKWLLTAEYGGTGGQKVEGGMVLEEPDIEIGAGVSSKAMSKRIGPDNAPPAKRQREHGGRHGKNKGGDGGYGGYSGVSGGPPPPAPPPAIDYGYARPEPVAVATPPAVPGFGFSLGLPPSSGQNNSYR